MTNDQTVQTISNQQARRLILSLQGLCRAPHRAQGPEDLYDLIVQLGFVQVDSIQWVERAHHMILFARNQTYRPKHLHQLLERDRLLFENWTHDASFIPSQFFAYWRHKFEREKTRRTEKFNRWQGDGYLDLLEKMRMRIQNEGELLSRDLEKPKGVKPEMWQWHEGKAALEFLWRGGEVCIGARRSGFQKVYQPLHNCLREDDLAHRVSHEAFIDWACRSALDRLGFGTASDIAHFWDLISIAEVRQWLDDQSDNSLTRVSVQGWKNETATEFYARRDIVSLIGDIPKLPERIRVLSPFDPVIRDRKRLENLFGFNYRIEIYVPEEKRVWGYYVFPLLEGDRLIGRIDMRAKRKENCLEIKRVWLEPGIRLSQARRDRLESELIRQARLAGVKSVVWLDGALAD